MSSLTPPMSISKGAPFFSPGEYVLLRVPGASDSASEGQTMAGSGLSLTPSATTPQHFCFVRNAALLRDGSVQVEVYCQLSFSSLLDPPDHVMNLPDAKRARLIPLPPVSDTHPPPELFGPPLHVGGWKNAKPAWLNTVLKKFTIPGTRSFKRTILPVALSHEELFQIENYSDTLAPAVATTSNITPHDDTKGPAASEPGHDDYGYHGPLIVLEDVDADATGEDCTLEDELALLAYQDDTFLPDLLAYRERQQTESKNLESLRQGRVGQWIQGVQGVVNPL